MKCPKCGGILRKLTYAEIVKTYTINDDGSEGLCIDNEETETLNEFIECASCYTKFEWNMNLEKAIIPLKEAYFCLTNQL